VTAIEPTSGPSAGSTNISITGEGFTNATGVSFGAAEVLKMTVQSDTQITVTSPPGNGVVDVVVETPAGTSDLSAADKFTYVATIPVIGGGGFRAPSSVNQYARILPYDAEEFGVYKPLLNWYGYQGKRRFGAAASAAAARVIGMMADDHAVSDVSGVIDPSETVRAMLVPALQSQVALAIAEQVSQRVTKTKAPLAAADWQRLLTVSSLQRLVEESGSKQEAAARWPALQGASAAAAATDHGRELAAADFFRWASLHTPDLLNMLFLSTTPSWRSALNFIDPLGTGSRQYFGRLIGKHGRAPTGMLSPVGLINLYREYFFQLDTFLGPPVGHIWVSPGGSLEIYEASTRSTTVTQTTEMSTTETAKSETDTTDQDELSTAVKTDNKSDTKLGASVNAGGSFLGVVHASAEASYGTDNSVSSSNEQAHKHSRMQSQKLSKEITQNYKTTFQTVTTDTDTTSRRYVLSNNTTALANYELRRKLSLIGVQLQHIGTRLSWQAYVRNPASLLGVGEFVPAPPDKSAASGIQPPPPWQPSEPKEVALTVSFPAMPVTGTDTGSEGGMLGSPYRHEGPDPTDSSHPTPDQAFQVVTMRSYGSDLFVHSNYTYFAAPPAVGYTLSDVRINGTDPLSWAITRVDSVNGQFSIHFYYIHNFNQQGVVTVNLALVWSPPSPDQDPSKAAYDVAFAQYQAELASAMLQDYINTTRTLIKSVSGITPRPDADLRYEERDAIYRQLYATLTQISLADQFVTAEYLRELFDVDNMLYYVEPDYYLPRPLGPIPGFASGDTKPSPADPLAGSTISQWPRRPDTDYYLISEDSQPAPQGSSLGWTIQLDGDERRNEFLNASWVKAVIPIQPGRELDALEWLQNENVEGVDGLADPYIPQPNDPPNYHGTVGEVLTMMATELAAQNSDISKTLGTETIFEAGFDPLANGIKLDPSVDFKQDASAYETFDFWLEIMPTDQVVAVAYDPTQHGA
jgi:hypothetical protein